MLTDKTRQFIKEHANGSPANLALQAGKYPEVDMHAAVLQIAGRQIIAQKVPSWYLLADELLFPPHLSLEQCSSESTARYKASLLQGEEFVDLTGGFGIDCAFLSTNFKKAAYVERQEELCNIARHNFPALGLNHVQIYNEDSVRYLNYMAKVDYIFIDPARRDRKGGKAVAIADCEPNVADIADLLLAKAERVMIKLSPMLDLSLALQSIPSVDEVHVVSVANECKELLLILTQKTNRDVQVHCVNIVGKAEFCQTFTFTKELEQQANCKYALQMGNFLYEPNSSILKAGAYKIIAGAYNLQKLHANSHLYTSDDFIPDFPGRVFRCDSCFTLNKKDLKEHLNGITKANITVRNFPSTVEELRKRLKLTDGGDTYLFATTIANDKKVLLKCTKNF